MDELKHFKETFSQPNPGKPSLNKSIQCERCGRGESRDWYGVNVCDDCPLHPVDPEWSYPDYLGETELDNGIFVRTCALSKVTKFGQCYHSFAVSTRTSQIKEIRKYFSRVEALSNHQRDAEFVRARRERLGYGRESSRGNA